jgi:cytochrome c oxidase subunit 5b
MKAKGYDDPYDMEPLKCRKDSTKENPNVILTLEDKRMLGCICSEDTHHVNFMWIHKGETKRCECGHWFTCKERELPDLSEYGFASLKDNSHH